MSCFSRSGHICMIFVINMTASRIEAIFVTACTVSNQMLKAAWLEHVSNFYYAIKLCFNAVFNHE